MTALPPAVIAALKAADRMAECLEGMSVGEEFCWCRACNEGPPQPDHDKVLHAQDCPYVEYLASRKEIPNV